MQHSSGWIKMLSTHAFFHRANVYFVLSYFIIFTLHYRNRIMHHICTCAPIFISEFFHVRWSNKTLTISCSAFPFVAIQLPCSAWGVSFRLPYQLYWQPFSSISCSPSLSKREGCKSDCINGKSLASEKQNKTAFYYWQNGWVKWTLVRYAGVCVIFSSLWNTGTELYNRISVFSFVCLKSLLTMRLLRVSAE